MIGCPHIKSAADPGLAEVSVRPPETPGDGLGRASAVMDVSGDDLGLLIGRRGTAGVL